MVLAWLHPPLGAKDGPFHPAVATKVGIALIFLLQGLLLDLAAMRQGAGQWKLHLLVQGFTFLGFPIAGLAIDALGGGLLPPSLRLGFLYLFVLPSTVSTAVVYTTQAGGNTPAAIFNATLSSLIGVFATPLWTGVLVEAGSTGHGNYDPWSALRQLVLLVLLPLVVGMALRPSLRAQVDPRKKKVGNFNSALVLFMVYVAFCDSFGGGLWSRTDSSLLFEAVLGVALALGLSSWLAWKTAAWLGLGRPEQITSLFCAPQKTLASGVPMAGLLFAGRPDLGLILLPLLLYHPLQLLVGGVLVDRLRK